jgi:uncharacterized C2H2 Zn-finger protein
MNIEHQLRGDVEYKCEHCEMVLSDEASLKRHVESEHLDDGIEEPGELRDQGDNVKK